MSKLRLLKPEEAARRAKANVAAFKREKELAEAREKKKALEKQVRNPSEAQNAPKPAGKRSSFRWPKITKEEAFGSMLRMAVEDGRKGDVEKLIEGGVDPEIGGNALVFAAECGYIEIAEMLIGKGVNVNVQRGGRTALMHAARRDGIRLAKILIDAKADVGIRDAEGKTALHYAAGHRGEEAVKLLIENGAEVDAKDNNGATALMYAARNGYFGTANILIGAKADVNAKNNEGETALIWSAREGQGAASDLLIMNGAAVNARNVFGQTALKYAIEGKHEAVVNLLRMNGGVE